MLYRVSVSILLVTHTASECAMKWGCCKMSSVGNYISGQYREFCYTCRQFCFFPFCYPHFTGNGRFLCLYNKIIITVAAPSCTANKFNFVAFGIVPCAGHIHVHILCTCIHSIIITLKFPVLLILMTLTACDTLQLLVKVVFFRIKLFFCKSFFSNFQNAASPHYMHEASHLSAYLVHVYEIRIPFSQSPSPAQLMKPGKYIG